MIRALLISKNSLLFLADQAYCYSLLEAKIFWMFGTIAMNDQGCCMGWSLHNSTQAREGRPRLSSYSFCPMCFLEQSCFCLVGEVPF